MDGKQFDDLARLAGRGASRRSLIKALFGIGGASAAVASIETDARTLRTRSTLTTAAPPVCEPGHQFCGGQGPEYCCPPGQCFDGLCCAAGTERCGDQCVAAGQCTSSGEQCASGNPCGTVCCPADASCARSGNSDSCCGGSAGGAPCGLECCSDPLQCCDRECCASGSVCLGQVYGGYEEICCPTEQTCDGQCCDGTCYHPLLSFTGAPLPDEFQFEALCCPPDASVCSPTAEGTACCQGETPKCCPARDGVPARCMAVDACCNDDDCAPMDEPATCKAGVCDIETGICSQREVCQDAGEVCCLGGDTVCCPPERECCGPRCCEADEQCCSHDGQLVCIPKSGCCVDEDCEAMPVGQCESATCDQSSWTCAIEFAPNGMQCDGGSDCWNFTCQEGSCTQGEFLCRPSSDCYVGLCNVDNGNCEERYRGDGTSCGNGGECVEGECCVPPGCCRPRTCMEAGVECGTHSDGCDGTINCGSCSDGFVCDFQGKCVDDPSICITGEDHCALGPLGGKCGGGNCDCVPSMRGTTECIAVVLTTEENPDNTCGACESDEDCDVLFDQVEGQKVCIPYNSGCDLCPEKGSCALLCQE